MKQMPNDLKLGGIYYVQKRPHHSQPAIILSDIVPTKGSGFVAIVYLAEFINDTNPAHVSIISSGRPASALCDRITTIDISKIGTMLSSVSESEMKRVHKGIAYHLKITELSKHCCPTKEEPRHRQQKSIGEAID